MDLPPLVAEFLRELGRERFPATRTFQVIAVEDGDGLQAGDTVIYARADGWAVDGKTVVAVMADGQIKFGRASAEEDGRIRIGDATYPRHMVRGIVLAAYRLLDDERAEKLG